MSKEQNTKDKDKALNIGGVVCSTDWEQVMSEHETAAEFAIFIKSTTVYPY